MRLPILKEKLKGLSTLHLVLDSIIICLSLYMSLYLRVGQGGWEQFFPNANLILPLVLLVRLSCLIAFGCYRIMWRYITAVDVVRIGKALALSAVIVVAATFFFEDYLARLPRTVYIIDALLASVGLLGIRITRRTMFEGSVNRQNLEGQRTLVYGCGHNGRLLAQRFKADPALSLSLVGFIDDDLKKQGLVIHGVPVLGVRKDLARIIESHQITQLIISIPNIDGEVLREVVMVSRPFNIRPRVTTSLVSPDPNHPVQIYREIQLTDLLNRSSREIDLQPVREMIKGKRVLVTGAGGSIGSEIARQIFSHEPSKLILLDHSEFNLYSIDKELRISTHDHEKVVPLLLDLKEETALTSAVKQYSPEVVFHAAAYKHVHLVESNPYSSILNNVYGTQTLLDACEAVKVETFVLISTDKAVNPAGVMGATKRVCELLTTAKAIKTGKRYCSVRFGNVLGSSGSLIPLLQKQISEGGPVTVTHPDMTRFFMLIPEAVSLVLKAATIARPGDINVLKMGEPVKILDVAKSLIALYGKTEKEIPIMFTGLRPGEKMFEELYIRGDELKTEHPDILTLPNGDSAMNSNPEELRTTLNTITTMITSAKTGDKEALFKLNELVKSKYLSAGSQEDPKVLDFKHRN